ncbi:MAG: PadR family transcriptional regulator [Gemmatimonadetes bacterium]|nr:PadR family transcriptional regulator [Gemmatimonadota bacterium]
MLPLKAIEFEVLLSLYERELHGYGMAKEIEERTAGRLRLEPANLYRRVHRLVQEGLVEEAGQRRSSDAADERRRYFRITAFGREVLRAEAVRMRDQVEAAAAHDLIPDLRRSR